MTRREPATYPKVGHNLGNRIGENRENRKQVASLERPRPRRPPGPPCVAPLNLGWLHGCLLAYFLGLGLTAHPGFLVRKCGDLEIISVFVLSLD